MAKKYVLISKKTKKKIALKVKKYQRGPVNPRRLA